MFCIRKPLNLKCCAVCSEAYLISECSWPVREYNMFSVQWYMKPEYTIIHHLGAIWKKVSFSSDIERAGKLSLPPYNKKKKKNRINWARELSSLSIITQPHPHPPIHMEIYKIQTAEKWSECGTWSCSPRKCMWNLELFKADPEMRGSFLEWELKTSLGDIGKGPPRYQSLGLQGDQTSQS